MKLELYNNYENKAIFSTHIHTHRYIYVCTNTLIYTVGHWSYYLLTKDIDLEFCIIHVNIAIYYW